MKPKNAAAIIDCTLRVRAFSPSGRPRPNAATMAPNSDRISTSSSIEPSWLPQVAETLNSTGICEFECAATIRTEKSDTTKACVSAANAKPVSKNCNKAAGTAARIQSDHPLPAPTSGTTT